MKRKQLLATCITLCVAVTCCEKPRSGQAPSAAVATQRDSAVDARVRKEIAGILGKSPDAIKATDQFVRDLGADSLDTVEIVMAVEEAFNIAIADADAVKLITVGDLIDYVSAKSKAAAGVPDDTGANHSLDENQVKTTTKFVEITSGTEELSFDWIVSTPLDADGLEKTDRVGGYQPVSR